MPVRACGSGKFRIGSGKCIYKSRSSAERAQRGYYASRGKKRQGGRRKK